MAALLTIQIVGWNSAVQLVPGLKALQNFADQEVEVRYIDNNSSDASIALVKKYLPRAHIISLSKNEGYARAHNIGFAQCRTPYVLTHDPDVVLVPSAIKILLAAFNDPKLGSAQGKLMRQQQSGDPLIDSAGIILSYAFNGIEKGANEKDHGQYDRASDILAATGACAMYRLSALKTVGYNKTEFFDNSFFAYKEDVDLGWRLKRAGWQVKYVPVVTGWHNRTLGIRGLFKWGNNIIQIYQRLKSPRTKYSIRNWVWMIIKNISVRQAILQSLFIGIRLLVFIMLSILYLPLFGVWFETIRGIPAALAKRRLPSLPAQ